MNMHFISFLVDVASWVIGGFIYGAFIARFERAKKISGDIAIVKITLVALLGGLIATADRALPAQGFAVYHFMIAMLYAFLYSLTYFVRFRKYILKRISYAIKLIAQSPIFRREPSYK